MRTFPPPTPSLRLTLACIFASAFLSVVTIPCPAHAAPPQQSAPTTQLPPVPIEPLSTLVIPSIPGLPAGASPDGTDLPYLGDPRVAADLGGVAVDTPEFRLALGRYRTSERSMQQAQTAFAGANTRRADLNAAESRLIGTFNQATRRHEKAANRHEQLKGALALIAVNDYMRGSNVRPTEFDLDVTEITEQRRERELLKTVRGQQRAEAELTARAESAAAQLLADTTAELDDVRSRISTTTKTRDDSAAEAQQYASELPAAAKAIADARLTGPVPGLDFVFVALDAYYKAAQKMAAEQPNCGIRWQLVAGISRTEGRHGTFNGAALTVDGTETKPIIGIALDGSDGTAVVADTDGGKYDGDPTSDRAVGPMQFIPSTWDKFGRDGNNDGKIDPQNMYDAALGAAVYLCRSGPGLATDEGMLRSLLHYNNDSAYGQLVLDRTHGYDTFVLPPAPKAPTAPVAPR